MMNLEFIKKNLKAILAGTFFVLFLLLIILLKTVDVEMDIATGKEIGFASLNKAVRDSLEVNMSLYDLADYLGYFAIAIGFAFAAWAGVRLLVYKFSFKKMGYIFLLLGSLYIFIGIIYLFFEFVPVNYRPVFLDGEIESSFPSSHTVLGICVYWSAPMVLHRFFGKEISKILFSLPFILLSVALPIIRFLSGVHWMTDIIGGTLLSVSILFLFSYLLDKVPDPEV